MPSNRAALVRRLARRAGAVLYRTQLRRRRQQRAKLFPSFDGAPRLSLLTAVYERTPAPYFAELVESVRRQRGGELEWVVLAHGAIPAAVASILADAAKADSRIRVLNLPHNLGIIGGLRHCLETATGAFVLPVDADDLLEPDLVQVLGAVLARHPEAHLVYADEDLLDERGPHTPYRRPDWDPVLNVCSSYIWHPLALRRDTALGLGIYSDAASNYCHDWDSVMRFTAAGHSPVHVPEVLYHWRTHAASHTNTASPDAGSLRSQRHVLEEYLRAHHLEGRFSFEVTALRGAPELHLRLAEVEPVTLLAVGSSPPAAELARYPWQEVQVVSPGELEAATAALATRWCVILGEGVHLVDPAEAVRTAQGLFALHVEVGVVAGRLVDTGDVVVGGAAVLDSSGRAVRDDRGARAGDPGPYALWLKERSVDVADLRLVIGRGQALGRWLRRLPQGTVEARELAFGAAIQDEGLRLATSPRVLGRVVG